MSTGQTLLAIAAISLFMMTAVNVNRTYVNATSESVRQQRGLDAINYAQSLSEIAYSQASNYDNLATTLGVLNDVTDPAKRTTFVTQLQDTLFGTFTVMPEQLTIHSVPGRPVIIRVFSREDGAFVQRVENRAIIIKGN